MGYVVLLRAQILLASRSGFDCAHNHVRNGGRVQLLPLETTKSNRKAITEKAVHSMERDTAGAGLRVER